ncbi:MAG: substrate-binding domain-containing protein [Rhizobiaceae bacterium]|nr:substrate-binding domain-containing protein [Rhizobiaceae bacterium]
MKLVRGLLAGTLLSLALVAPALAQDVSGKDLKIAVVLKTLANPYWLATQQGIEAKAKELGATVTVQAGTDESSIDEQTNIVQTMVGQDYNCFIVAPISNSNLIQPLVTAAKKNIPIVAGDAFDDAALEAAGVKLATYVTVRHTDAGKAVAEEMVKRLGGSGKVALIGGLSGHPASIQRLDGFRSGAGGLEIVQEQAADWDREKALNAADAILRAHPDLKGFYAANDGMALGVQQAVNNANLTGKVMVFGTDAIDDALTSIEAGQLTGTAAQFPFLMGQIEVEACLAAAQGASIEPVTVAPQALITSENVAAAKASSPQPWFEYQSPVAKLIK